MKELRPGLYEDVTTDEIERALAGVDLSLIQRRPLEPADAEVFLGRYLNGLMRRALAAKRGTSDEALTQQVALANGLVGAVRSLAPEAFDGLEEVAATHDLLLALMEQSRSPVRPVPPPRPETPLSSSALLVNGRDQPRIGAEVIRELASAASVDLISAFIKWHGLRLVASGLRELVERGGRLRIITTTYMGATDRRALDALLDLGAEIKVSYETRTTRLHAKAWLFHRDRLSTAYVGSSNLSRTAMTDGLEWNVRLSAAEQPHLVDTFQATFDDYWNDPSFETYTADDAIRFDEAVARERGGAVDLPIEITTIDVRPYPFQQEVLEQLDAERSVHGRWRSLVVMATGTGKTVVSALDYQRLRRQGVVDSLLFVAHREEILRQSASTFRHVIRDGSFGELYVGGHQPNEWRHVFASVQSLANLDLARLDPAHFSMVIVDEFHHAQAPTYARLLAHVKPGVLLGLTATPERTDGEDVTSWFDGRIAVELRLWEALERGLLSPFQYFGVADDVDLSGVTWKRGRYDDGELIALYSGNQSRAAKVIETVREKIGDAGRMRALGFCVGVEHARFMAREFVGAGIPSVAVSATTDADDRRRALVDLRDGRINAVFAVDLFNEGVDVPEIDTVLFLRPTESSTLFLQQLGRGLRLSDDKACLTVLDFIGNQRAEFRFDRRFRSLTGSTKRQLQRQLEQDFPYLPPGCHIQLDRVAKEIVLDNVRRALRLPWRELARDLRELGEGATLREFLDEGGFDVEDLYSGTRRGWTALRHEAGFTTPGTEADDELLVRGIRRMLHVDDPERLELVRALLGTDAEPSAGSTATERQRRLRAMLHFTLWGSGRPIQEIDAGEASLRRSNLRDELAQVADVLDERRLRVTRPLEDRPGVPLQVHARYTRDEALAAFGLMNPQSVREGVKYVESERADLFFVTLQKTEQQYSPSTMYRDRAITPSLFQWESQSTTTERSRTGQRYLHHEEMGTSVHLFVRETKDNSLGIAAPYLYAGPAHYASHRSERPIEIIWQLEQELPADVFHAARAVAG